MHLRFILGRLAAGAALLSFSACQTTYHVKRGNTEITFHTDADFAFLDIDPSGHLVMREVDHSTLAKARWEGVTQAVIAGILK